MVVQKLDVGLLILRVGFGLTMLSHGYNKIFSNSGIRGTAQWFGSIGMKWPNAQARIAATSEIISGAFFALGLFTGVSSIVIIGLMMVAIITVHARVGFFIFLPNGGWEYCASIICCATAISLTGPGEYSLDSLFGISNGYAVCALPVGVLLALCHVAFTYRPPSRQTLS